MLVLARHKDEVIMIGDSIRIVVADVRGDKVKIGIDCDKEIPVHRLEVWEEIKRARGKEIAHESVGTSTQEPVPEIATVDK